MWSHTHALLLILAVGIATGNTALQAQGRSGGASVDRGPVLTGVLRDEAGEPLAFTDVQACTSAVCFFTESSSDGNFRFDLPNRPAPYVVKTVEDASVTPRRAAALAPIRVSDRSAIHVGSVYVPNLPEEAVLPAGPGRQTAQPGDGLQLTLSRTELVAPPGKVLMGLAARRIPPDRMPSYRLPDNETVVAVFALHPFAATSKSPIAVRAPSSLPTGTPVQFRTIDDIDGSFSEPVPGRATGTHVATDVSAGITQLTHLVITTISK